MEHSTVHRPTNALWSGLALLAATGILYLTNDWPSSSPTVNLDLKWPTVYTATTLVFLFLLFIANQEPPRPLRHWASKYISDRWATRLIHAAGLILYGITSVALVRRLAAGGWRHGEVLATVAIAGCAGALAWSALRPFSAKRMLVTVAIAGLVLRLVAFWLNPLSVESSDMLPLVGAANRSLLAGTSPYRFYDLHPWPLPLPYLPGTWLAYLPAAVTGLDLRLVNAAAELVVLGALAFSYRHQDGLPLGTLIAMLVYLSPPIIIFDIYTEHPVFWTLITLLFALLAARRIWAATLVWGIALATSLLTLTVSPLIALHLAHTVSPKRWWKLAALTAAPFLALTLPFAAWAPCDFLYGTLVWLNDPNTVARSAWVVHGYQQLFTLGFAGWLWYGGWEWMLKPIQVILLLAVSAHYWKRGREEARLLPVSSLWAYTLFIALNPIIWPRHYAPALCLAALAAIQRLNASPATC